MPEIELSREQVVERIAKAIEKAATDKSNEAIAELDGMAEYFGLEGVYADHAEDLAEVAFIAVQDQVQLANERIAALERWRRAVLDLCADREDKDAGGNPVSVDVLWPYEIRALPMEEL